MADEAKFSVRLIDKVRGPGRAMAKALGRVRHEVGGLGKAVGRQQGRLKKLRTWAFGTKGGLKGERGAGGKFLPGQQGFFEKHLKHLDRAMRRTGGAATGMWKQVAGGHLAAQAVARIAQTGAAAARSAWEFVNFGQRSELALSQLGKHGATGPKLFELARTLSKKFGSDIQDTTVNLQKLLSAQFDPKLSTDIIKMGADLRAIGATAEDTSGAVRAITQIKGAGKLMGQELLQLANAGVSVELVRGEIGKLLGGKSVEEVIKLQESGQIDADTAIQGILNAVQKKTGSSKLGEAGAKFADTTIEGMMGRSKAIGEDAALTLTKRIEEPLTRFLGKNARRFDEWLNSPKGVQTMTIIGDALEKVLGLFEIMGEAAGQSFLHTLEVASAVIGPVFKSLGADGEAAAKVARTVGKVLGFFAATAVVALGAAVALGAGVMYLSSRLWEGAFAAFDWLVEKVRSAIVGFDDFKAKLANLATKVFDDALDIGKSIVRGIAVGIASMAGLPVAAVEKLGSAVVGKLKGLLGIRSPSRVFAALGADTTSGFAIGIERGERSVQAAGHDLATAHLGGFHAGMTAGAGLGGAPTSSGAVDLGNTSAFGFGDLTSAAMPAPQFEATQVGGGGRAPIRVDLHTEVHAGSGDADEIARLSARSTRRELEAFFRELDLET